MSAEHKAKHKAFTRILTEFLRRQGQSAADKISALYGKKTGTKGAGDSDYSDEIDKILDGWKKLARQSETPLEFVCTEAAEDLVEGFAVSSAVDFSVLNEAAFNYAKARAAEMVGMKWSNGEMIPNPSARWAITDTTRDKLRQLISRAYTDSLSAADLEAGHSIQLWFQCPARGNDQPYRTGNGCCAGEYRNREGNRRGGKAVSAGKRTRR